MLILPVADNAFKYLDVFRSKYRVFNDDVSKPILAHQRLSD